MWILRYLNGTINYGLIYESNKRKKVNVDGFVDADYTGDLDKKEVINWILVQT